jgi:hypothetical protein
LNAVLNLRNETKHDQCLAYADEAEIVIKKMLIDIHMKKKHENEGSCETTLSGQSHKSSTKDDNAAIVGSGGSSAHSQGSY